MNFMIKTKPGRLRAHRISYFLSIVLAGLLFLAITASSVLMPDTVIVSQQDIATFSCTFSPSMKPLITWCCNSDGDSVSAATFCTIGKQSCSATQCPEGTSDCSASKQ